MTQTVNVPGVGQLNFPDGMSDADMAAAIQKNFPDIHPPKEASTKDKLVRAGKYAVEMGSGLAGDEAVLKLATGAVAAPTAGLAGVGAVLTGNPHPEDVVEKVQHAMTYEPRTEAGQDISKVIGYLPEKLAQGADYVGEAASNAGKKLGFPKTGAAVGAAINTAIQAVPALVTKGVAKYRAGAAADAATDAATTTPEEAAKAYVARNTALDWDSLSQSFKARLTSVAKEAGNLDRLDPKAVERQGKLASMREPVPATRGQLTKDPVQLRNEANTAATDAGRGIREIDVASNRALLRNLDILKGKVRGEGLKTAGKAETPEQVGQSVQDKALRAKADASEGRYRQLYDIAKKNGETKEPIEVEPLLRYLDDVGDPSQVAYVQGKINALRQQAGGKITQLSLDQLDTIRKSAVAAGKNGGTAAHYASEVKNVIDKMTEGKGGGYYKAAREAFMRHKVEFEDQAAVARLVEDKSRTDRATALEDTWRKTILGGSIEDLNKVKKSLLIGGTEETRAAGRAAWRDMKAQTVQHIKDQATKGVGRNEAGEPNITISSLSSAIKSIVSEKLKALLGNEAAREANKILDAADIVKNDPRIRSAGATTMQNWLAMVEKGINKVPGLGPLATGTARLAHKAHQIGKAGREVSKASTSELEDAAAAAERRSGRGETLLPTLKSLESAAPVAAMTQGSQQ